MIAKIFYKHAANIHVRKEGHFQGQVLAKENCKPKFHTKSRRTFLINN
jgi:hypothetical protein